MKKDKRKGWLAELREGDTVIISHRFNTDRAEIVSRVTPTGIIKVGSFAFKPNGWLRSSDTWDYTHLAEPTKDRIESIQTQKLIAGCRSALTTDYVCKRISLDMVKRIYAELLPAIRGDAKEVKP